MQTVIVYVDFLGAGLLELKLRHGEELFTTGSVPCSTVATQSLTLMQHWSEVLCLSQPHVHDFMEHLKGSSMIEKQTFNVIILI